MRATLLVVALFGLLAMAQAGHRCKTEKPNSICRNPTFDYRISGNRIVDVVKGDFAQEAWIIVAKAVTKAAIEEGVLPQGCSIAAYDIDEACYYSLKSYHGKQCEGIYEFKYDVAWRCPNRRGLIFRTVVAKSLNVRRHPHAEFIEAFIY